MSWDLQPDKEETQEAIAQRTFKVYKLTRKQMIESIERAEKYAMKTDPKKFVQRKYEIADYIGMATALIEFSQAAASSEEEVIKEAGKEWTKQRQKQLEATHAYTMAEVLKDLIEGGVNTEES